ncbi:MAG TPA: hypothetical protein VIM64_07670, partial [Puia sp.]
EKNPLNTGYSSRLGANFGVSGSYRFSPLFSLEARLELAAEGGKKNGFQALTTPDALLRLRAAEYSKRHGEWQKSCRRSHC